MKAIILVSSIFYILGLKISNKIDLVKHTSQVEKVIVHTVKPEKSQEAVDFKEAEAETKETETAEEKNNCEEIM